MKLFLFYLFAPLIAFGQSEGIENQLLWEISGKGMEQPSYLFGSFHSNDKRLFKLADSTFLALQNAELIALETDIFSMFNTWDTRSSAVDFSYDNTGTPYVSSPEASETMYGNEDGMPQFLDAFFEQFCYNAGKNFAPLESVDFQLNLWENMQLPDFSRIRFENVLMNNEDILDAYLMGDIYTLDEILRSSLSFYPGSYKKLITDRNFNMARNLDSLIQSSQGVFCAVGAGHLPGALGVINLLRNRGYTLRRVQATFAENLPEKSEVFGARVYEYHNDTLNFSAVFPGKPMAVEDELDEYILRLIYREFGQGNTFAVEIYNLWEGATLESLAEQYIASPQESKMKRIEMDNGLIVYQGIADSYPEGAYWARVTMNDQYFMVIKAYGGNKFMNSKRAQRFFDRVWFD